MTRIFLGPGGSLVFTVCPATKSLHLHPLISYATKAFNCSLAVIGVLLLQKSLTTTHFLSTKPKELRAMLDTAMEILLELDGGSKSIVKCRDTLSSLMAVVDSSSKFIALL